MVDYKEAGGAWMHNKKQQTAETQETPLDKREKTFLAQELSNNGAAYPEGLGIATPGYAELNWA